MTSSSFAFSSEKNSWLIANRGLSFEEIIAAILADGLLDVVNHPNLEKYPHQKMYVVELRGYVYLIPFVEDQHGVLFLKTVIPSRKAKKKYLESNDD